MLNKKTNIVRGMVRDGEERPLSGLIVEVYDKDMRSVTLLGESLTDKEGKYELLWSKEQLGDRERKSADILLKILTPKQRTLLYESSMDEIHFNASEKEEINVALSQPIPQEEVEYEVLLDRVTLLAHNIPVTELQENEKHQDISFLAKEAEVSPDKLEHLVVAQRVQAETDIDAAFFYALLRQNTLLKQDLKKPFLSRLNIGIESETMPLVYEAALIEPKKLKEAVKTAVKEMTVSTKTTKSMKQNLLILESYKKDAAAYYENEHPKKVLESMSRFLKADALKELFDTKFAGFDGVLENLNNINLFESDHAANDAKTTMAMGVLLGFDEVIIAKVKEIENITKPEDIKKLAMLNKSGWEKVLSKSAKKITLAGKPINKEMITFHASSLTRKLEKEYPSVAFFAQLERSKGEDAALKNPKKLIEFMGKYEEFDLANSNIELFMKEKKLSLEKNKTLRKELKTVQRVFKLVPHYSKANALLKEDIHSAHSIVALGKSRFMNEVAPKTDISPQNAKEIFDKAEQTNIAAMLIAGDLQDISRTLDIAAVANPEAAKKLEAVSKDFPDLKSLFSLGDACECQHCRSVYSPAAYMVETLQFLKNRSATGGNAKDILFQRRPDLGELDLNCANANTPVPYIDLVCELLEEAVDPDTGIPYSGKLSSGSDPQGKISKPLLKALTEKGLPVTENAIVYASEVSPNAASNDLPHYLRDEKVVCKIEKEKNANDKYKIYRLRQTLSSAQELDAKPEYVNAGAYEKLKKESYAFTLPFDLAHVEAQAYFERFGVKRASLMEAFQVNTTPENQDIAAEKLGLNAKEKTLIVTANKNHQEKYWNKTPVEMKKVRNRHEITSLFVRIKNLL